VALEYLAHQFGVLDVIWVLAGTVEARRELLAQAIPLQGTRGTVSAVQKALAAIGWDGLTMEERTNSWAHYRVSQPLAGKAVTAYRLQLLKDTLAAWVPARCVLEYLDLGVTFSSSTPATRMFDGTYTFDGSILFEGAPIGSVSYVLIGEDTPTIPVSGLTVTQDGTTVTVAFSVDKDTANGLTLNSYSLHSAAGTVIATASTVDVWKTSDVSLSVVWTLTLT
jgi:hypothetical protein